MFRPVEMKKIQIIIVKRYFEPVMMALMKTGVVHLIDAVEEVKEWEKEGLIEEVTERIYEPPTIIKQEVEDLLAQISDFIKKLYVSPKPVTMNFFKEKTVEEVFRIIKEKLIEIDKDYSAFKDKVEDISLIEAKYKDLKSKAQSLEHLPETSTRRKAIIKSLKLIEAELQTKTKLLKDALKSLTEKYGDFLLGAKYFLERLLTVEESKKLILHTRFISFIEGWVPSDEVDRVVKVVNDASENTALVNVSDPEEHDQVPVILRTPRFLKPFESLIKTYDIPSYHELNPSVVVAITFPLLFGLTFADVGHGLILFLAGVAMLYFRRKGLPPSEMIELLVKGAEVYMLCGIAAIFGGLMFGEMFGFHLDKILGKAFHHPPLGFILESIPGIGHVFSPLDEPMKMFKLALIVGAFHISLGLTLSAINEFLLREYKKAFFGSICWLWFYIGFIYLGLYRYKFNIDMWISGIYPSPQNPIPLTLVGVLIPIILMFVGMIITEGFIDGFAHTFEALISSLSHTVSYGRILALSLSHGILSRLLTHAIPSLGAIGFFILAIGTIFLVIALEGLVSFTHVLRLTWVEFGFKYFHGGGIEYKPIKLIGEAGD